MSALSRIPVLTVRMNADLHMAGDLKNTGKGNLFVIFGDPDVSDTSRPFDRPASGRIAIKVINYLSDEVMRSSASEVDRCSNGSTLKPR